MSLTEIADVRPAVPGDLAFIYKTWLRDLRHQDAGALPDDLWFPPHRELISRVLADPAVLVLVACPKGDPNLILGYVVAEPDKVLHWIHVKPKFQGRKLTPLLLQSARAESAVGAWSTPSARAKLRNRPRSRSCRPRYARA